MRAFYDKDFEENTDAWANGLVSASERRVKYAWWVSKAWRDFFAEGGQAQVRSKKHTLRGALIRFISWI